MQPSQVTAVILAGGQGRRMGGRDKGLVMLDGRPLIIHVIERLRGQVGAMLIVANRNRRRYTQLGYPVVADTVSGFQGPLVGIAAGMAAAETEWVQVVPCDAPRLPLDLVARLGGALERDEVRAAVAVDETGPQPVVCLLEHSLQATLMNDLHQGLRQVKAWLDRVGCTTVGFDDQPGAFANINTPDAIAALQSE
jgi:molybdopterin-guanine dinucleotide biosynthesis protein A